jgi:signal transduction histidine kinase/CheY-like chemotaxis protein
MTDAMEQELRLALDIADSLVSTKIELLKSNAANIAGYLVRAETAGEMTGIMESMLDDYADFLSLTVLDQNGIIADFGVSVCTAAGYDNSVYMKRALTGEVDISTTHYDDGHDHFVIHIFVPMGRDRVLSATIPAMIFSDLISGFKLWNTGSIFIVDEEATMIANVRDHLVYNRFNFITDSADDPGMRGAGSVFSDMLDIDEGSGSYYYDGQRRLSVYKRVSSANVGWHIGVVAPYNESPMQNVLGGMLFASLLFLASGVIVSIFFSRIAIKPFVKIQEQNSVLAELNDEIQEQAEQIHSALTQTEKANSAKSDFLASMSHEMRTPLNAVIGLSELVLEDSGISKTVEANLEKIYGAGETLLSLVNDILDISKIEAGKFELNENEYDVPSLINDTVTNNIIRIGEKPIEFILSIKDDLPALLFGDELRIKQVLSNLLSNAIKYTKQGTVELGMDCSREGETVWLTAWVKDSGMGIKPEDIGNLFSDYAQMDIKSNRKVEGTGLGLPIAKKMTELMNGTITVESEYGKGSVFTIRIEQKHVTDVTIGAEVSETLKSFRYSNHKRRKNAKLSRISLPNSHVLVVDDNATNLDVAKGLMKPYGMRIDTAPDGAQAVYAILAEDGRYDAVFMDHMMPGMDGIEAVRRIREIGSDYALNIPVIALTANAITGNEKMFLAKGFQDFLPKPIDLSRLDAVIRQWVRDKPGKRTRTETPVKESPVSFDGHHVEGVDLAAGLERFGGDGDAYLRVLRSYVLNTRNLLVPLGNTADLNGYAITVHGIKGSSRSVCASMAGDLAEALEKAAKDGDADAVERMNRRFTEMIVKLLDELEMMLEEISGSIDKPKKSSPDKELLGKILEGCRVYDMEAVESAVKELERYEYESGGELVRWLWENVQQFNVEEMIAKLEGAT